MGLVVVMGIAGDQGTSSAFFGYLVLGSSCYKYREEYWQLNLIFAKPKHLDLTQDFEVL